MLHELPILVRKFFQAISQRIAPRLQQTSPLDRVFRQEVNRRIAPSKLAYDMDPPRPPIEPGSMLVFEIELLEIVGK